MISNPNVIHSWEIELCGICHKGLYIYMGKLHHNHLRCNKMTFPPNVCINDTLFPRGFSKCNTKVHACSNCDFPNIIFIFK